MSTTVRVDRVAEKFLNLFVEDFLTQINPLWKKILQSGKEIGTGSHTYRWPVRALRSASKVINVGETLDFQATDIYRTLELEYKNFVTTELLYDIEREQAHGKFVVNVAQRFVEQLRDTLAAGLSAQAYADGDSGAALDGARSWTSYSDSLGSATALMVNNDTYGGQSTAATSITSDTTADGYRLLSPNLIDATSTEFTGSTWLANAREAVRKSILLAVERGGMKKDLCVFMNTNDYSLFLDNVETDTQLHYVVNGAKVQSHELGFNMVYFDGVPVYQDHYCPAKRAFILNFSKRGGMGVISPRNGDFITVEQDKDIDVLAEKYVVRANMNFIFRIPSLHGAIITGA